MSHYSRLYDIQTLAMLSCVFVAGSGKWCRAVASTADSSQRADRRRPVSQTATTTDLTPANVGSSHRIQSTELCYCYRSVRQIMVAR